MNPILAKRIRQLLKDILRNPENGIGKPERLRFSIVRVRWSPKLLASKILSMAHEIARNVNGTFPLDESYDLRDRIF